MTYSDLRRLQHLSMFRLAQSDDKKQTNSAAPVRISMELLLGN